MTDFPTLSYPSSSKIPILLPRWRGAFHYRGHYKNGTFDILLVMFMVLFTHQNSPNMRAKEALKNQTLETSVIKQSSYTFSSFSISGCSEPLGMKSGKIKDYQITASSSYSESRPSKARGSKTEEFILSTSTGHFKLWHYVFKFYPRNTLRKQPTFRDAITGFLEKWRLRNEYRITMLMMCHYPYLGNASDWL